MKRIEPSWVAAGTFEPPPRSALQNTLLDEISQARAAAEDLTTPLALTPM